MRRRIASVLIAAIVAMMGVFQQLQGFAMALETLPKPTDQDIRIYNTETYPTVSRRFSGRGAFKNLAKHENKLRSWVDANNLQISGEPEYPFYNPPFLPPMFRRNEVHFRIVD